MAGCLLVCGAGGVEALNLEAAGRLNSSIGSVLRRQPYFRLGQSTEHVDMLLLMVPGSQSWERLGHVSAGGEQGQSRGTPCKKRVQLTRALSMDPVKPEAGQAGYDGYSWLPLWRD